MSEQAIKANELLQGKHAKCIDQLDKSKTYLFEIIYPENCIVTDFGYKSEFLNKVPDEFYNWVRTTIDEFWESFRKIEEAKAEYKELEDRKQPLFIFRRVNILLYYLRCTKKEHTTPSFGSC